ncbi:MAG TPA: hypothetical protein VLS96_16140 [Nodosilinea sp.]|nr:hypothetical protein [Nodosilinea sp.]
MHQAGWLHQAGWHSGDPSCGGAVIRRAQCLRVGWGCNMALTYGAEPSGCDPGAPEFGDR